MDIQIPEPEGPSPCLPKTLPLAPSRVNSRNWHSLPSPSCGRAGRRISHGSPPAYGPDLLRRSLAYKLQEDAFGKLPASTRRELDRLAAQIERNRTARVQLSRRIKAGSVLVRDWQGKSHRVTVLARGFEYEERTYQSFSEIARLITGTRWNGPRFCRSGTRSTNRLWVDRGACLRRTRRGDLERGRLSSMPDRANGRALIQGCGMAGGGRRQPRRACVRRSLSAVWPDRTQLRNRDDQRVGSRPLAPADVAFLQQGICHIARSHRKFWRALYRSVVIDLRRERRGVRILDRPWSRKECAACGSRL